MDNPLKLLKDFILKLLRVFLWCWKLVTFHVEHPSTEHIDGQNLGIPSLENLDDFLHWYEEHCKKVDQILARDNLHILNAKQCQHLFKKLKPIVKWMLDKISLFGHLEEFKSILNNLHCLVLKAFSLVEECGGEDLCVSAIFQLENEESFRELLLELECCFKATYKKIQSKDEMNSINFEIASYEDVEIDRKNFKRILGNSEIVAVSNMSPKIIEYLLGRLEDLDHVKGGELDTLKFADCGMFEKGEQLGEAGGDGSVYKSKWLGITCATKVLNNCEGQCDEKTMENFRIESSILAGLNHPNLVRFMGMGKGDDGWPFLLMEKMDKSVKKLIIEHISYDVLLDIIQQIANGMYYLHDMHVAHRDLKPDNILWTPLRDGEQSSSSFGYIKLTDFGISKIEVGSEGFEPDSKGTSIYRAPEVMKFHTEGKANYFQADVYSFGITCAELLCGKLTFEQEQPKYFSRDLYVKIKAGVRPNLPSSCGELSTLIRECCAFNPLERPTFSEIWKRLRIVKINYLVGQGLESHIFSSNKVHEAKPNVEHAKLFGVDEKVKELQIYLCKVNSLGIIGMGGVGKTTIAKALLHAEEGNAKFNKRCFHYIGELQSDEKCLQALQDILTKLGVHKRVEDFAHGQIQLKEVLAKNNTLLILDDVRDSSDFNKIISQDMFCLCPNSTLIVCSRNMDAMKNHVEKIYHLQPLRDRDLSMKLFTTHCFDDGKANMPNPFSEVGSMIVEACQGLPLSLKVLGAFLYGKERLRSWERVLQRMKRGRSPQTGRIGDDWRIFEVLKISFDGLQEIEKTMFLDICCFFLKDVYGQSFHIHPDCTHLLTYGESSLRKAFEALQRRSLVEVRDGMLHMHDHLRDMGREIVELKGGGQPSSLDKYKKYAGTRLQDPSAQMFEQMKEEGFDFQNLEGVSYQVSRNDVLLNKYLDAENYPKLRMFLIYTEEEEISYNFKNLTHVTFLKIYGSHLKNLPKGVENMKSLKSLNLHCSRVGCLPKTIFSSSLISLDLSGCSTLSTMPDALGNLSSLTSLDLKGCYKLSTLPNEVGNLSCLTSLNLQWCSFLTLPNEVGNLSCLTSLDLSECSEVSILPNALGNLSSLTSLNLSRCSELLTLPDTLGNLSSLTSLDLSGCSKLSTLPDALGNLPSLTSLDLSFCSQLSTLPDALGNLSSLTSLGLSGCSNLSTLPNTLQNFSSLTLLAFSWNSTLLTLPDGLENLSSLRSLDLSECSNLSTLPDALENLSCMTSLNLSGCSELSTLPNALGNLPSLTSIDLSRCSKLSTLPDALENLSSLTSIDLSGCSKLSTLPNALGNLSFLTSIDLRECSTLLTLPDGLGNLSSLTSLSLRGCSTLSTLPDALGNLSSLTSLDLRGCDNLSTLPDGLGSLSSLTLLDLRGCSKLSTLPDALGNLSSLTSLNLRECSKLSTLPDALGSLSTLTSINLSGCSTLLTLPDVLGNLSSLTSLDLGGCSKLLTLPNEVGNLSSLMSLRLSGCSKLSTLPDALGNLSSLTSLRLSGCSKLSTLPDALGNLSSLTSIDLNECSTLSTLPDALGNLSSLTSIDLSRCSKLLTLPDALGNLSSLTSLNLSCCSKLLTLPDALGNLSTLRSLNLSCCSKLLTLPDALGNLSSLTSLDLCGCDNLSTLPDALGNLSSLISFDLRGCDNLSTLPNGSGNLSSLTSLDLRGCDNLSTLPDALGNLSSLISLGLSGCSNLMTLPDALGNLSSLRSLDLSGCSKLSTLPNGLGNLSTLTTLDLSGCSKLSTLSNSLGNLSSLTSLSLSGCSKLSTLPDEVGNLSSLMSLGLSGCSNLLTLPDALGNLSSLTSLGLSGCSNLSTLPDALGNLSSLTSLNLSGCSTLSTFPNALRNLSSLTSLNLSGCSKLLTLPDELRNLSSLTSLDLSECSKPQHSRMH